MDKSTDIVLLTIGGNDLFFAEVVEECFFLGFGNNCWNAIEKAETLLNNGIFKTRIISALQAIRKRIRDDAIIILPTYPDIVRKGSTRWLMAKLKFDAAERVRMTRNALQREQQAAVDQVNRDNGLKGGFVYFFTESKKVFENREPLPNLDDPWDPNSYIWDIRVPGVTSGPDTWLDEVRCVEPDSSSFLFSFPCVCHLLTCTFTCSLQVVSSK